MTADVINGLLQNHSSLFIDSLFFMQTEWACSNLQFPPPELILFLLWTCGVTLSAADHESAVCGTIKLHLNPKTNKRQAIKYADVTRKNPGWVIQGSEVKTHDLKVRVTILI